MRILFLERSGDIDMNNWKRVPENPEVAKYIDCYWLIEKTANDVSTDYPKLNPDPAAHLLLAPGDQKYRYQFGHNDIVGSGSHLILPNTSSILMDHSLSFIVLGLKFHVGALYSLTFGRPLPLVNSVVTDTALLPSEIQSLSILKILLEAKGEPEKVCAALDEILVPWLRRGQEDSHSELVRKVITIVDQTPIAEIGGVLNCSQRTVERAFRKVSGLTLKQYQSMTLLESLLAYLHRHEKDTISWTSIATEFGFSDQSHLIRKLKTAIGATPNAYLKHRNMTIDVYGDFE